MGYHGQAQMSVARLQDWRQILRTQLLPRWLPVRCVLQALRPDWDLHVSAERAQGAHRAQDTHAYRRGGCVSILGRVVGIAGADSFGCRPLAYFDWPKPKFS